MDSYRDGQIAAKTEAETNMLVDTRLIFEKMRRLNTECAAIIFSQQHRQVTTFTTIPASKKVVVRSVPQGSQGS